MKVKHVLILIFLVSLAKAQHNPVYSQYMFNGLLVNPAYAGSTGALNFTGIYRNQWAGLEGAPTNINLSLHAPSRSMHHNLGLLFVNDKFGITSNNRIGGIYAYRIQIRKSFLALGLQAGVHSLQADWSKIRTSENVDPSFAVPMERKLLPQAGAGIYFHSTKFFLGISAPELMRSAFNYKPYILFTGYLFKLSETFLIKPAVMVKYLENSPVETDFSSTFYWKDIIGIGLGYRPNHSAIAFLDLKIRDQFRLGYAYDHNMNKLRNYSGGSHEIMVRFLLLYKVNAQSSRYF